MSLFLTITAFGQQSYIYYEYDTICSNTLYSWHGQSINDAGVYYDSLTTVAGGDSVYIMNIYILQSYEMELNGYICQGDSFNWMGSSYSNTGTYYVNYSTACGCDSTYVLNLTVIPKPHINLGPDISANIGDIVTLDAGIHDKYLWSSGGISQYENITIDNLTPISVNVSVQVTDNLCSEVDQITINFLSPTAIEPGYEKQFSIYPNPSSGQFNIKSDETYRYKVYDISGNKIIDNEGNGNSKINLSDFKNGMYFMELKSESETQSVKLIKNTVVR